VLRYPVVGGSISKTYIYTPTEPKNAQKDSEVDNLNETFPSSQCDDKFFGALRLKTELKMLFIFTYNYYVDRSTRRTFSISPQKLYTFVSEILVDDYTLSSSV